MLFPRPRKPVRIPHPVAALAALVLAITAWTGATTPASEGIVEGTVYAGTAPTPDAIEASAADDSASGSLSGSRPAFRISLMLFRFN